MDTEGIIDRFLFSDYYIPSAALGIYRICYASFFLLFGIPNFTWVAQNPDAFFFPPDLSLAIFFEGFPSYAVLYMLSIVICLLFLMLLFGLFTKTVSITLTVLVIVGKSFAYSFGKIDHDIILWLVPLLMGIAGWGNALSLDTIKKGVSQKAVAWPVAMMALLLGFAFFTAGAEKMMGGWLHISTQASRYYVLQSIEVFDQLPILGPFALHLIPETGWEIADYATVFFEVTFLAAVIKVTFFRKYIFAALFFHLFIFLLMGITTSWLYIVYLAFIDWDVVLTRINRKKLQIRIEQILNFKIFVAVSLIYIPLFVWGQNMLSMPGITTVALLPLVSEWLSINYYQFFGVTTIFAGVAIGLYTLYLSLYNT